MLYRGKDIDDIKQHWDSITKSENCRSIFYMEHAKCLYDLERRDLCKLILKEGLERYRANIYLNNFYAYFLYEEYTALPEDNTDDSLLNEALTCIEPCFKNPAHVEPEFVDTYLHILEVKKDYVKIN